MTNSDTTLFDSSNPLLDDVRALIRDARQRVAVAVNAELTLLYWDIGSHIRQHVLGQQRADYGKRIVDGLSEVLTREFGKGWGTPMSSEIGNPERETQRRVIALLSDELGYRSVGPKADYDGNDIVAWAPGPWRGFCRRC